jgi:hypothetical protein
LSRIHLSPAFLARLTNKVSVLTGVAVAVAVAVADISVHAPISPLLLVFSYESLIGIHGKLVII